MPHSYWNLPLLSICIKRLGVPERWAWLLALSGKDWWRMANRPQASAAMTIAWFKEQGLVSLADRYEALKP